MPGGTDVIHRRLSKWCSGGDRLQADVNGRGGTLRRSLGRFGQFHFCLSSLWLINNSRWDVTRRLLEMRESERKEAALNVFLSACLVWQCLELVCLFVFSIGGPETRVYGCQHHHGRCCLACAASLAPCSWKNIRSPAVFPSVQVVCVSRSFASSVANSGQLRTSEPRDERRVGLPDSG